jgi:hypothetical protein
VNPRNGTLTCPAGYTAANTPINRLYPQWTLSHANVYIWGTMPWCMSETAAIGEEIILCRPGDAAAVCTCDSQCLSPAH